MFERLVLASGSEAISQASGRNSAMSTYSRLRIFFLRCSGRGQIPSPRNKLVPAGVGIRGGVAEAAGEEDAGIAEAPDIPLGCVGSIMAT